MLRAPPSYMDSCRHCAKLPCLSSRAQPIRSCQCHAAPCRRHLELILSMPVRAMAGSAGRQTSAKGGHVSEGENAPPGLHHVDRLCCVGCNVQCPNLPFCLLSSVQFAPLVVVYIYMAPIRAFFVLLVFFSPSIPALALSHTSSPIACPTLTLPNPILYHTYWPKPSLRDSTLNPISAP